MNPMIPATEANPMAASPMVSHIPPEADQAAMRLDFLFMHIVQHQGTFDLAYSQLEPDMLANNREMHYRHVWRCIKAHWDEFGRIPAYESLCTAALPAVAEDSIAKMSKAVKDMIIEQTETLLAFMYAPEHNAENLEVEFATAILRELLIDRGPELEIRRAVASAATSMITNLPDIVQRAQKRIEDITSLGTIQEETTTVPKVWEQVAVPRVPCGVEWVDTIMGGGAEPGNCMVIMGPTGGGKTTTSMQIAVTAAALQPIDPNPGLVVFISYEDDMRMIQIRATSCGANVLKDSLRDAKSGVSFSSVGNLKPYEQSLYGAGIPKHERLGEIERIKMAEPWLDKYLHLVDFHDPAKGGRGGIPEVRARLMALQEKHGLPIKTVVLDWAGTLVTNYLQGIGISADGSRMSLELQDLVRKCKHELGIPFGCTVWIPHQLTGKCNKASPSTFPHHADAQWCSTFSDHATYAFVLGTKDKEHSIVQFGATKTRHGETPGPIILKVDGAFCRMVDVTKQFSVDRISGRLVPQKDAAKFHVSDAAIEAVSSDVNSDR